MLEFTIQTQYNSWSNLVVKCVRLIRSTNIELTGLWRYWIDIGRKYRTLDIEAAVVLGLFTDLFTQKDETNSNWCMLAGNFVMLNFGYVLWPQEHRTWILGIVHTQLGIFSSRMMQNANVRFVYPSIEGHGCEREAEAEAGGRLLARAKKVTLLDFCLVSRQHFSVSICFVFCFIIM